MNHLTINSREYPIKGGYSAIRNFCVRRSCEFYQFFERLESLNTQQLTLQNVEDMGYIVLSFVDRGCEVAGRDNDLKLNDVIDWFGENPENMTKVIEMLASDLGGQSEKKRKVSR